MDLNYKINVLGFEIKTLNLFVLSNITFIILYLLISYFNRISIDDFYFLNSVNKYGIIDGTIHEHSVWSGRWVSVLITHTVLYFYSFKYSLFTYQIGILLLFIFAIYRLLKNTFSLLDIKSLKTFELLNWSVFIVSALFYSCFKIDETWFWLCASSNYLLSVVFFILGISCIINPNKTLANILLCAFSFTYIGGSCEPLALFSILILLIFIIGSYFSLVKLVIPISVLISRALIAILFCSASFTLLYIANGNRIRENFFEDISAFKCFILNFKTTGMIVLLRLPQVVPYLILFTCPAFYLAISSTKNNYSTKSVIKRIICAILVLGLILYIYQFPVTYVTQDIAAYRALFPITLISLIISLIVMYNLGLLIKVNEKIKQYFIPLLFICTMLINTFNLYEQSTIVPKYSKAFDDRIAYLLMNKETQKIIELHKLPNAGLLLSAEISTDSLHFSNLHLQMGLNLKSKVILKP